MNLGTVPVSTETEALQELYAALNRNDIPSAVAIFGSEIEVVEPPEFPMGGIFRGLASVQEHFAKARTSWAEGTCEPERFLMASDKVVVVVYVHVRLKHETEWREGQHGDGFVFRNGKVTQMRIFAEVEQALEWAGIDEREV